jgi:hypothetical protein
MKKMGGWGFKTLIGPQHSQSGEELEANSSPLHNFQPAREK